MPGVPYVDFKDSLGNPQRTPKYTPTAADGFTPIAAGTAADPLSTRSIAKGGIVGVGERTYRCVIPAYAGYASATDFVGIENPAGSGKLITPTVFTLQAQSTSAALMVIDWIRRTAPSTGGTSATTALLPEDSASVAATGVARSWSVIPAALGASAGIFHTTRVLTGTLTAAPGNMPFAAIIGIGSLIGYAESFKLRPGEALYANLRTVSPPGGFVADVHIQFTETDL